MSTQGIVRASALGLLGLVLVTSLRTDRPLVELGLRSRLSGATLVDVHGRRVALPRLRDGQWLILAFTGIDCPIGNLYMPRLAALDRAYRRRGVVLVGINSNAHESADQVAEHSRSFRVPYPVLKDPSNRVADLLGVERTCEVIVLDPEGRVRYRGAIDNQYSLRAHRDGPTRAYLAEALEDLLAGRDPATVRTEVVGCPIDRVAPQRARSRRPKFRPVAAQIRSARDALDRADPADVGAVNYARDVAPILQRRCQPCHRPGQVGRFSLLTYRQARRWATSIREVVEERRMPPWHADPRYGRFENDRSLSARERATLLAWVEQKAPAGDLAAAPTPRSFPDGWTIGPPDVVFEMPEEYQVPAEGTVPYQHFRVKTRFKEDCWVQAVEARPGNRAVVHHIVVLVDDGKRDRQDPLRYMKTHLVSYAPGDLPAVYSDGVAKLIPAGSVLVFEVHYTPVGTAMSDRSSVGLILAKAPVRRRAYTLAISKKPLVIPPGVSHFEAEASFTFSRDAQVLSFMPHMHLRGKDFQYRAVYPDGRSEILLSVPAFDFAWQSIYRLAEPLLVPRGTRIECLAHFDNSAANPANPDSTKTVTWGEQTWDEMMIGFLDFAEDLEPSARAKR
jgi:peroxiredoxin